MAVLTSKVDLPHLHALVPQVFSFHQQRRELKGLNFNSFNDEITFIFLSYKDDHNKAGDNIDLQRRNLIHCVKGQTDVVSEILRTHTYQEFILGHELVIASVRRG